MAREFYGDDRLGPDLKKAFGGVYIANEKYTLEQANKVLAAGEAEAVAFGKLFHRQPRSARALCSSRAPEEPNPETFYTHDAAGYTDYPSL